MQSKRDDNVMRKMMVRYTLYISREGSSGSSEGVVPQWKGRVFLLDGNQHRKALHVAYVTELLNCRI